MGLSTLMIVAALVAGGDAKASAADQRFDLDCKLNWVTGKELPFRYIVDLAGGEACNAAKCARAKVATANGGWIVLERQVTDVASARKVQSITETRFFRSTKEIVVAHSLTIDGKAESKPNFGSGSCKEAPFTGFGATAK